jgi:hypothetical protein
MVGSIVRSHEDRSFFVKLRKRPDGLVRSRFGPRTTPFIAITNVFVRDRNGNVGPKALHHYTKKGAVTYPQAFSRAGILGNGLPNPDGLPFVSSSNVYKHHCTQMRAGSRFRLVSTRAAQVKVTGVVGCIRLNRRHIAESECANCSGKLIQIRCQPSPRLSHCRIVSPSNSILLRTVGIHSSVRAIRGSAYNDRDQPSSAVRMNDRKSPSSVASSFFRPQG